MMVSANYAGAVKGFPRVDVHVIEGIDHMGTVSDAKRCRQDCRGRRDARERGIMSIESREAAEALADIEQIADRVRQSRFYNFASLILILWGALVFAGYVLSYMLPRHAG